MAQPTDASKEKPTAVDGKAQPASPLSSACETGVTAEKDESNPGTL